MDELHPDLVWLLKTSSTLVVSDIESCLLFGLIRKNIAAGVIDEDYRGLVKVVLFNHSETPFEVKKGDRIAQLICERIYYPDIEEVKVNIYNNNIQI